MQQHSTRAHLGWRRWGLHQSRLRSEMKAFPARRVQSPGRACAQDDQGCRRCQEHALSQAVYAPTLCPLCVHTRTLTTARKILYIQYSRWPCTGHVSGLLDDAVEKAVPVLSQHSPSRSHPRTRPIAIAIAASREQLQQARIVCADPAGGNNVKCALAPFGERHRFSARFRGTAPSRPALCTLCTLPSARCTLHCASSPLHAHAGSPRRRRPSPTGRR